MFCGVSAPAAPGPGLHPGPLFNPSAVPGDCTSPWGTPALRPHHSPAALLGGFCAPRPQPAAGLGLGRGHFPLHGDGDAWASGCPPQLWGGMWPTHTSTPGCPALGSSFPQPGPLCKEQGSPRATAPDLVLKAGLGNSVRSQLWRSIILIPAAAALGGCPGEGRVCRHPPTDLAGSSPWLPRTHVAGASQTLHEKVR